MQHANTKVHDCIRVGYRNCIIRIIYSENSHSGICQVVFNKDKPTTHDVCWNGTEWFFPERPDYGGYAPNSCSAVRILKKGKY